MIDGINQLPAQTYFYPFFFNHKDIIDWNGIRTGGTPI